MMHITRARVSVMALLVLLTLSAFPAGAQGFYVDLQESPIFVRTGFEPEYTTERPGTADWKVFLWGRDSGRVMTIQNLDLPGVPKRRFLSPFGAAPAHFTFVVPFDVDEKTIAMFGADTLFTPGLFLASAADNWDVYLNGELLRSEMHVDRSGRVIRHAGYREIRFPVPAAYFRAGENILAFHIVGDPTYQDTGFFLASPYYLGSYDGISRRYDEAVSIALIAVYFFMGIYHLFMYALRRKDRHNLFYGLLSLALGVFFIVKTTAINYVIPDREILLKMEMFSVILAIPLGALFIEYFCLQKTFLVTRIYSFFYLFLAVVQLFFSMGFSLDVLAVWRITVIAVALLFLADMAYIFVKSSRGLRAHYLADGRWLPWYALAVKTCMETPIGNLLLGILISISTAIFDIIDDLALHLGLNISQYGFFILTVSIALILARRFAFLYSQQERIIARSNKGMNARLVDWIVVQDKDPGVLPSDNIESAIMFTDVRDFTGLSEGMSSATLTEFLVSLNEVLAKPVFSAEDLGYVAYTDKFMGDCMMNIFTDPAVALRTAVKLRSQLDEFNAAPRQFFKAAPDGFRVEVGTGIAFGPVTLGVMGHSRRVDYTPIGDTVNLASRLEGLTKIYRVHILINDFLYNKLDKTDGFCLRRVDRIRVKGKHKPVDVYEEFSADSESVREMKMKMAPRLRAMQELYFSGADWKQANEIAQELLRLWKESPLTGGFTDYVPVIFAQRIRNLLARPDLQEGWDGVYTFKVK